MSSSPIYTQIAENIKGKIITGELEGGYLLPSIRVLAKELQVSVMTIKSAYQELEAQGLIHPIQGKGFYVTYQKKEALEDKKIELVTGKIEELVKESKRLGINVEKLVKLLRKSY